MTQPTLHDRDHIVETCTKLGWHTDEQQWDDLTEIFADEVALDYTSLAGGEPAMVPRTDLVASWRDLLSKMHATQHLIANHLVDISGDNAVCTAQFQATHLKPELTDGTMWVLGGKYRFDLVRTSGGWRISGIVMTVLWETGNRGVLQA